MAEVTIAFQVCSETINAAEVGLLREEQQDTADMLRIVQTNEHEKLRLTLILQALQQSYVRSTFSWNGKAAANSLQAVSDTGEMPWYLPASRLPLTWLSKAEDEAVVVDALSHACQCCTAAEPTEAEFSAAKAEALQGLQSAINNINDMLEEIKYVQADLDE